MLLSNQGSVYNIYKLQQKNNNMHQIDQLLTKVLAEIFKEILYRKI